MCGIGLLFLTSYATTSGSIVDDQHYVKEVLKNRGPDHQGELTLANAALWATATVLHIQGESLFQQPVVDSAGNVLLWNGEVFDGIDVPPSVSDTKVILDHLLMLTNSEIEVGLIGTKIMSFLATIKGPFSIIYYHQATNSIFFGRDSFGRRSLTMYNNDHNVRALASTTVDFNESEGFAWEEVEIGGIYSIGASGNMADLVKIPWHASRVVLRRELELYNNEDKELHFQGKVDEFLNTLKSAVSKRVQRIGFHLEQADNRHARIGVLFSGGIDSLLLAAVLHLCLPQEKEPIELFNIAFVSVGELNDSQAAPDRLAAIAGCIELQVSIFVTSTFHVLLILFFIE